MVDIWWKNGAGRNMSIGSITRVYGHRIVAWSPEKPQEFYVEGKEGLEMMTAEIDMRRSIMSMAEERRLILGAYVVEKLPSIELHTAHEPDAQLSFKLGGTVKRRYWEKVLLPTFTAYAEDWGAEFRYSYTAFGVSTRWHWEGPFQVVHYPDNTPLLSAKEQTAQDRAFDRILSS